MNIHIPLKYSLFGRGIKIIKIKTIGHDAPSPNPCLCKQLVITVKHHDNASKPIVNQFKKLRNF